MTAVVPAKEDFAPRPKWARARKVAGAPIAWDRALVYGLAPIHCTLCYGVGLVRQRPCKCVLRAVFRACLERYREFQAQSFGISSVNYTRLEKGRVNSFVFGRKLEEFLADFELTASRTLTASEWLMFERHYLQEIPFSARSRVLYHQGYAIEQKLGRAFVEMRPYALYPIDEYMGVQIRRAIRYEREEKRMAA